MIEEKGCKTHPDAPHGFMRDASHQAGEYVCECAFWEKPEITKDRIEIDCPRCGGAWYADLDESGTPYTCYHCCNGTHKCYKDEYENNGI
jgi:hypothetical protein